ncbi:hypothetical protein [Stenotrophomonas sp.]|uniref:hypothetical protein n=1 Tax=Stenotrophomonas sp. TaxID=69392 RepID=UPI00289F2CA8|nr:hypothetical protein [Stenotrophomonas sp.]
MNHDDAKADLDDFAAEMMASTHSWNYSKRLDTLRSLEILAKRALRSIAGLPNEAERRNAIEAVLDRIKSMLSATEQLEALQENYRH